MKTEFDSIVIGLGGLGSAAAYWLGRRADGDVLGLERFELGHDRGASQDHSRIIRLSYHTPGYVRMAARAYQAWSVLEEDAGEQLIVKTGGLDLWPEGSPISTQDYTGSLEACSIPFELLEAGEIVRRWPEWRLPADVRGVFQPEGGLVAAARANAAHQRMAREYGATLLERTPVLSVRDRAGEVEVATDRGTFRCRRLAICADAWTNELLADLGTRLPLSVTQEQVVYFGAPHADRFAPDRFPVWIWMDDPSFYGLPAFGEAGPKVAQDVGGREVTAEDRTFDPDPEAFARVERFVRDHLPSAMGPVIALKTCLYTLTPDRDFVIDAVPEHPAVFVTLGAAHGFKFASLIGRTVAELMVDGDTEIDLEPFRIDRTILTMADPPVRYLT